MDENTYKKVESHMRDAKESIKSARHSVQTAIVTMTDTNGINLQFTKDIKHTLSQLYERFDIWQMGPYDLTPGPEPEARKIGDYVKIVGTTIAGEITAIYSNYEESGITAYAVRMPQKAIEEGCLPIEIFSSTLLDVPNI